jgi:lysophospholipid acyltransferase (LPLAT)-like uncharacterized protein
MKKENLVDLEEYYLVRNKYDKSFVSRLSHSQRVAIHPLLLSIIKLRNKSNGFNITKLCDDRIPTEKPKIFCITHIGKFDIEVVSEAIEDHYYLLSGDFENIRGTIEEKFLGFNGVIYVREDDKEDRKQSKEKMINTLKNGGNLMYFPEGTWNLSPNLPVLQCPYGIIDVAMKSGATIIPVAIEEYEKDFICAIGENFDVDTYTEDDKITALNDLKDKLATLKLKIWESVPINCRKELKENEFQEFIDERLKEWPNFSLEEFYDRVFKPKNLAEYKDVFKFLKDIELNTENAFLAKSKLDYEKQYIKKK